MKSKSYITEIKPRIKDLSGIIYRITQAYVPILNKYRKYWKMGVVSRGNNGS